MSDVNVNFPPSTSPFRAMAAGEVEALVNGLRAEVEGQVSLIDQELTDATTKVFVENFKRQVDETDDTPRVMRAIEAAPEHSKIIFKHDQTYNIKSLTSTKSVKFDLNGANYIVDPTTGTNGVSGTPFIFFTGSKGTGKPISVVAPFSSTITPTTPALDFAVGDYVLIEDDKSVLDWTDVANTGYTGRSEPNYITAIDGATGTLTLNSPLEWAYDTNPRVSKLGMIVNPSVEANGAKISEVNPGAEYNLNEDILPHIFSFRYCVNPKVTDFHVDGWQLEVCNFKHCINPIAKGGYAENPFRTSKGGHGYFSRFDRCRGGSVAECTGKDIRHMVDQVQSYDASSRDNIAMGCKYGAYMMHGLGAKRYTSTNDQSIGCDVGWIMGNPVFNADFDFTILNPKSIGNLGVPFQMMTKSQNMTIINPDVETAFRVALITTGANGFKIKGGKAYVKDGSTVWETILVRPEITVGDTYMADPGSVSIEGMEMTGRVYVLYRSSGAFTFKDNVTKSTNNTATCVYVDPGRTPTDIDISDNKFLGTFNKGAHVAIVPTRQYIVSKNLTSGHVTTPLQLYMAPNLVMFGNLLSGATDFQYAGDIEAAVAGGALIFGNTPNKRDNVNTLKANNVLTNNIDLVNPAGNAKSIGIYSGTKDSKTLRWLLQGTSEDISQNGADFQIVARNNDGSNKGTPILVRRSDMITFMDKAAVVFAGTWDKPIWLGSNRLWVDSTGKLRIKATAPTSDTDGTIVGSQT